MGERMGDSLGREMRLEQRRRVLELNGEQRLGVRLQDDAKSAVGQSRCRRRDGNGIGNALILDSLRLYSPLIVFSWTGRGQVHFGG